MFYDHESEPDESVIYSQKLIMVCASGLLLFVLYVLTATYLEGDFHFGTFALLLAAFIFYGGPVFCTTLKLRTPAIVLSAATLLAYSAAVGYFWYSGQFNPGKLWLAYLLVFLSLLLLFLFTLFGHRNTDSMLWVTVFWCIQAVSVFANNGSVSDILNSLTDDFSNVTEFIRISSFICGLLFFTTGYSPDHWYRKKET